MAMFLDGSEAKARDTVHVLFAGKKLRDEHLAPVPGIDQYVLMAEARTLPLDRLVAMKLTANRDRDRVHIHDMISIGLIDDNWLEKYSPELRARLKGLLEDPDG